MTKITIIGGTGFTGAALVREAASRGLDVTSVSRTLPTEPVAGVTYVQGTVANAPIDGADVVIGAVSPRGDTAGTLLPAYVDLAAKAQQQGSRLIIVGGFSSLRPEAGAPRFAEGDGVPAAFVAEALEMNAVLTALGETPAELDWVFVSPAQAYGAYAPATAPRGTYRVGGDVALFAEDGTSTISGPDFALAIIDEVVNPAHHRAHISLVD